MGNILPQVKSFWRELPDIEAEHKALLDPFLHEFDVTAVAEVDKSGPRTLAVYFLRPRASAKNAIGFEQEVALFVTSKRALTATTFRAIESFLGDPYRRRQIELLAYVLAAPVADLVGQVSRYLGENVKSRLIVPFAWDELRGMTERWGVRERFIASLAARDLFDMQQPLANDTYYFGRTELVADLIHRFRAGENAGLFGLRKTGKTSAVFKLRRHIESSNSGLSVYIDAQHTSIYRMRWWELLGELADRVVVELGRPVPEEYLPPYDEWEAARRFDRLIEYILGLDTPRAQRILCVIDEIEHIVPELGPKKARHWDEDFIDFWKTLRAVQTVHHGLSFLVIGVNPSAVERTSIDGQDNPLFSLVGVRYMPSFIRDEVREMVRTIGKPMGMRFSDEAYDYLFERYGGHPTLTRLACSWHHRHAAEEGQKRPCEITLATLQAREEECEQSLVPHVRHILEVLHKWYGMEYDMLGLLARGDLQTFVELAATGPELRRHLDHYGLLRVVEGAPRLRIEVVGQFLREPQRAAAIVPAPPTPQRDWLTLVTDISRLRNSLEPKLRRYVKQTLRTHLGTEQWIEPLLEVMGERQRTRTRSLDADTILSSHVYLNDLIKVIYSNWSYFASLERSRRHRLDRHQVHTLLTYVNTMRADAHANPVAEEDVVLLAVVCRALNGALDEQLSD